MANLKRSISKRLRALADAIGGPRVVAAAQEAVPVAACMEASTPAHPAPAEIAPQAVPGRFIHAPLQQVEVVASPDVLQGLVDMTAQTWTKLGQDHAHWSVLSWPEFMTSQIDEERFFKTGASDFSVLETFFERSGATLPTSGTVLELGCGVGRLTRHIGSRFRNVVAVDISQPHLDIAAKHLREAGVQNVDFIHLMTPDALESLPQVALFYSIIVLQHNPPPVAYTLLSSCLNRVAPGGYAYFQVPTYRQGYSFTVADYSQDELGRMEMHVLPQPRVMSLLRELGFEVLEVQEDGAVGDLAMASHTFFARRRATV